MKLEIGGENIPPHKRREFGALVMAIASSSIITTGIAGMMGMSSIPLTTVLPTSAPIWMGFATMFFMLLNK